jgi:branched-chain amino acid transport system permease protein
MKKFKKIVASVIDSQTMYPSVLAVVIAIAAIGAQSSLTRGNKNQLTELLIMMSISVAWNLIGGFGGQFSLGHSIFVGIGGYATAILLTYFGWPLLATVSIAALISAALGVLIAFPLLRLRGPYLAVGSLGMTLAMYGWMINWDFTKASSSYQIPIEFSLSIDDLYSYVVFFVLIAVLASLFMVRSPMGLRMIALREDEAGAASLGVHRVRTLLPFWAVSGLVTGMAGAFYALQQGTLTVDAAFNLKFSLDAAITSVIGGLGTVAGPILGAIVVYYVRDFAADLANWALVIEAAVVVLVVRFFPRGIMGFLYKLRSLIESWAHSDDEK